MLNALTMGLLFSHVLEMPQKMKYTVPMYLEIAHTLYRFFGMIGGPLEVAGLLFAIVLCFLARRRSSAFVLTVTASCFLALALAMWFSYVAPANAQFAHWTVRSIPPDWIGVREQWEYTHAADAAFVFVGVSLLLVSVLVEIPACGREPYLNSQKSRQAIRK